MSKHKKMIPTKANREMLPDESKLPVENNKKNKEGKILGEIAEKRERAVKYFLKDDLTYEAAIYNSAVHYFSEGKWKDIDNTLIAGKDEENNDILENKQNDLKVKFAKKAKAKKLITIQKDKYEISWGIDKAAEKDLTILNRHIGKKADDMKLKATRQLTENESKKTLKNLTSRVQFIDILNKVDVIYSLISDKVKENIVIKDRIANPIFIFNLSVKNVVPILEDDKTIVFYDAVDRFKAVFKVEPPFMYDAKGDVSNNISVTLEASNKDYKITWTPDNSWLSDRQRQFPITIDPQIKTSLLATDIQDSLVISSVEKQNINYRLTPYLIVGRSSEGINRSFIKFSDIPLKSSELVIKAELYLKLNIANNAPAQINVHKVEQDWNSSTITWNNQPSFNEKVEDYQIVYGDVNAEFKWDITPIAKEWYSSKTNYGLVLKNNDESTGYNKFYSSDTDEQLMSFRPQVTITYVNNSGLESYWTYHSQDLRRAGVGHINDYTGNLIFIHDDITMDGNRMPLTLNHIFNSNEKSENIGYGNGWRLNLSQKVFKVLIDGIDWYEYTDEDGTKHYFSYDSATNSYVQELDTDLTLLKNTDGTFTIKDKNDNALNFRPDGYLSTIKDQNNNTLLLNYEGVVLKSITDGAGRVTTLNITNNILSEVIESSGRKTTFSYTGTQLTRITYADGKYSTFVYDADNKLITIINHDGYKVNYAYYSQIPYRVMRIEEFGSDGIAGGSLNLSYGYNTTVFTDAKNVKNIYQFNDSGNTISIKDDDGSAEFYKYLEQKLSKKLAIESKLQKFTKNYLRNHNIEITNTDWTVGYWGVSQGTGSISTEAAYLGRQSLKIEKTNTDTRHYFSQNVTLTKGKTYVFSGYIKTQNITNLNGKGAALVISYQNNTGAWQNIQGQYIQGTTDWERYELKFTLPSDSASNSVYARVAIIEETGTAYFDCLQLEEGSIANRYNLVENADLSYGTDIPYFWYKGANTDVNDKLVLVDGKSAFKINGVSDKQKNMSQNIFILGKAGDVFSVGGWAKGASVPLIPGSQRNFAISIGILKTDGTFQWEKINFNEDILDWQYVSGRIIANSDYTRVIIYGLYYNNANTAYFTNFEFYKEEFGISYQYDANGNVISTVDLAKQESQFQYNANNDLIKAIDPKGSQFTYEYDDKHNMTKATSGTNVVYTFSYDSYGNPIKARVGAGTLFTESISRYTLSGNHLKSLTDEDGNSTINHYDEVKDLLVGNTDGRGSKTTYTYDNMDRLLTTSKMINTKNIEKFLLSSNTLGSKGTKPIEENSVFFTDQSGKQSLSVFNTNGSKVNYDLGIDKRSGTFSIWFKIQGISSESRIILGNEGSDTEKFTLYLDVQNQLILGVRDTNNISRNILLIGDMNISAGIWYFLALKWQYVNGVLSCTVYVNDRFYTGTITDFKDFTGGITSLGSDRFSSFTLKGYLESFMYSPNALSHEDIISMYNRTLPDDFGPRVTNTYTYENDKIKTITHNGFSYTFNYDSFGNDSEVLVAGQKLINNTYDQAAGVIRESLYGNNQKVTNEYDNLDRVVSKKFNDILRYKYEYDNSGNLGYHEDIVNNKNYRYLYDIANRLIKTIDSDGNYTKIDYDKNNNESKITERLGNNVFETNYSFDGDNRPLEITYRDNKVNFTYDSLGRLNKKVINAVNNNIYETEYKYIINNTTGKTSNKIERVINNGVPIVYEYDANGNIKKITENNKYILYYYNDLNELIQEDNQVLNKTIIYSYDVGGNIKSKLEIPYGTGSTNTTIPYTYDSVWKDKLISYNDKPITYDEIGNPLTYDGYNFTWEHGRRLKSIVGNGRNIIYKYNDDGIRTEKNNNGVITKYYLNDDKVTFEDNGIDKIYYTYDSYDNLVSMNLNGVEYYYIRNAQGDIIGLFDRGGSKVVSYSYDSWGKIINITGSLKDTVGLKNPYRYRSYRYDDEIQLYYLKSRYYNPDWGRFINSDALVGKTGELLSHNLFSYCLNNPINRLDSEGRISLALPWMYAAGASNSWNPVGVAILIGAVVLTAAAVVPWDRVGQGLSKQARTVSQRVASSFAKSKPRNYRSPRELHHLVAQAGRNAQLARDILRRVGIGINSSANLILIKTSLHRRLHTNDYYGLANSMVISAYNKGKSATSRRTNVYAALAKLRSYVRSLDLASPW